MDTDRHDYANGLRALANLIDTTDLPLPYATGTDAEVAGPVPFYVHGADTYQAVADLLGATELTEPTAGSVGLRGRIFGLWVEVRWIRSHEPAEVGA